MNIICVECPHCQQMVLIAENEINCGIFRHGVYKKNFRQINPHESEIVCNKLFNENLIYGCGKPFKIFKLNETYCASVCEYI